MLRLKTPVFLGLGTQPAIVFLTAGSPLDELGGEGSAIAFWIIVIRPAIATH
jgi:hypothetical protein